MRIVIGCFGERTDHHPYSAVFGRATGSTPTVLTGLTIRMEGLNIGRIKLIIVINNLSFNLVFFGFQFVEVTARTEAVTVLPLVPSELPRASTSSLRAVFLLSTSTTVASSFPPLFQLGIKHSCKKPYLLRQLLTRPPQVTALVNCGEPASLPPIPLVSSRSRSWAFPFRMISSEIFLIKNGILIFLRHQKGGAKQCQQ